VGDWREQFEQSLSRYITTESSNLSGKASVDDYIDQFIVGGVGAPRFALRAMAMQSFTVAFREFEMAMERCESPIEIAMLLALTLVGRDRLHLGNVYFTANRYRIEADDYEYLTIEPQAQIGEHRVDFLVTLSSVEPLDEYRPDEDTLRRIAPLGTVDRQLAVECDGHDFHDRTKAQASRDRARDRALQSFGIPVFRYTGSDIWKDVVGCAREAIDAAKARMWRPDSD